jgi:hypothetical protein
MTKKKPFFVVIDRLASEPLVIYYDTGAECLNMIEILKTLESGFDCVAWGETPNLEENQA